MQYNSLWAGIRKCQIYTMLQYINMYCTVIFSLYLYITMGTTDLHPITVKASFFHASKFSAPPTCPLLFILRLFIRPALQRTQHVVSSTTASKYRILFWPLAVWHLWHFCPPSKYSDICFRASKYQDICSAAGTFKVQMFLLASVPLFWLHKPCCNIFFWFENESDLFDLNRMK